MSHSILGLIRRSLVATVAGALLGCPGDPMEASTLGGSGSDDTSVTAEGPTTLDDSGSLTMTDTSDDDPTTDPTDTDPTGVPADCGNRVVEDGEACDLGPDNTMGATCTNECQANVCGDSYVGYGESCDPPGDECTAECILESCGNGQIDKGEECDPSIDPECLRTCLLPEPCGDGTIDPKDGEDCEPLDLGGATCMSIGKGFTGGELQCDAECHFVTGSCTTCGNGVAESPVEECDTNDLLGVNCIGLGLEGGTPVCTPQCTIDAGPCWDCGDDNQEGPEQCDGADLNATTCMTLMFASGPLQCSATCEFDTSMCESCGNGMVEPGEGEDCEPGVNLPMPMNECSELGGSDYDEGDLACNSMCELDLSDCCYNQVGHACASEAECCGDLQCDNQDSECCIPANGTCNNDTDCCSGDCNNGTNNCNGCDN